MEFCGRKNWPFFPQAVYFARVTGGGMVVKAFYSRRKWMK